MQSPHNGRGLFFLHFPVLLLFYFKKLINSSHALQLNDRLLTNEHICIRIGVWGGKGNLLTFPTYSFFVINEKNTPDNRCRGRDRGKCKAIMSCWDIIFLPSSICSLAYKPFAHLQICFVKQQGRRDPDSDLIYYQESAGIAWLVVGDHHICVANSPISCSWFWTSHYSLVSLCWIRLFWSLASGCRNGKLSQTSNAGKHNEVGFPLQLLLYILVLYPPTPISF